MEIKSERQTDRHEPSLGGSREGLKVILGCTGSASVLLLLAAAARELNFQWLQEGAGHASFRTSLPSLPHPVSIELPIPWS